MSQHSELPRTLGALRLSPFAEQAISSPTVKDELRNNLIAKLRRRENLFPGVLGYGDTVVPQVVNAVLSKHNFILLGLRGQAKTRLIRMLASLLNEYTPYLAGSEIRDNPFAPISRFGRDLVATHGEDAPIAWLTPDHRYIEKLATPDVTIADMIGDIDPIKAARRGADISDELTIHYGLLPRANRGIFAINELPDLAGKIQVGLFNIMQEGDVQIKGYPVRLPLDVLLVFTANPEDYTARGKIVTPLKDRIGSEIRTHYPLTVEHGMEITSQEAWTERPGTGTICVPPFLRETIEHLAFAAREDKRVDKRSGVSQRLPISVLENVVSSAEQRAAVSGERDAVPRIADLYAALPAITGKLELEYEGELKGGDAIARELIKAAVAKVYSKYMDGANLRQAIQWFELGGSIRLGAQSAAGELIRQLDTIQGLMEHTGRLGLSENESDAMRVSAAEFILEGLYAHRRISRNEELAFIADERKQRNQPEFVPEDEETGEPERRGKRRKNYN
jgi:magnesium chelatase subunit I